MIEAILSAILTVLTTFGTGVATFLNEFITELVFVTTAEGVVSLSAFATWSLAFLGLSLVLGLGALIVHAVKSKG